MKNDCIPLWARPFVILGTVIILGVIGAACAFMLATAWISKLIWPTKNEKG